MFTTNLIIVITITYLHRRQMFNTPLCFPLSLLSRCIYIASCCIEQHKIKRSFSIYMRQRDRENERLNLVRKKVNLDLTSLLDYSRCQQTMSTFSFQQNLFEIKSTSFVFFFIIRYEIIINRC